MMEDKGFMIFHYQFLARIQVKFRKTLFKATLIQHNLSQKKYLPHRY
jgi:hypothetical protein